MGPQLRLGGRLREGWKSKLRSFKTEEEDGPVTAVFLTERWPSLVGRREQGQVAGGWDPPDGLERKDLNLSRGCREPGKNCAQNDLFWVEERSERELDAGCTPGGVLQEAGKRCCAGAGAAVGRRRGGRDEKGSLGFRGKGLTPHRGRIQPRRVES